MEMSMEARFERYCDGVESTLMHADREQPARWYLKGLMLPGKRKSVEPMAARVMPQLIDEAELVWWIVDDTGFPKKGGHSVGVRGGTRVWWGEHQPLAAADRHRDGARTRAHHHCAKGNENSTPFDLGDSSSAGLAVANGIGGVGCGKPHGCPSDIVRLQTIDRIRPLQSKRRN